MKRFPTSTILGLILGILLAGAAVFEFRSPAQAAAGDNVSGWAWSETIGWISFNSTDCDVNKNGTYEGAVEGAPAGCPTSGLVKDYGVRIDPATGNFSGYAWASTIGWVSFNHSETSTPPDPPYNSSQTFIANLNQKTGKATGWARALAACPSLPCKTLDNSGGWDGWIKLGKHASDGGGVPDYGVSVNPATGEFSGWAWGSDVVGWISFNCQNIAGSCSQSNYKVVVGPGLFNQAPNASISCTPSNCKGYDTGGLTFNNNSTDSDSTDADRKNDIFRSEWDIVTFGSSSELICTAPALCNYTTQVAIPSKGSHTMKLAVQDFSGATSTDTKNFTILQDVAAGFMCSLNNTSWVVCETLSQTISQGEVVFLKDDSLRSEFSTPSEGAISIVSRTWARNGSPFLTGNNANPSLPLSSASNTLTLTVTDSAERTAVKTHSITPQFPLPEWQEISPF